MEQTGQIPPSFLKRTPIIIIIMITILIKKIHALIHLGNQTRRVKGSPAPLELQVGR